MTLLWFKHLHGIPGSDTSLVRTGESALNSRCQRLDSQGPSSPVNTAYTPDTGPRIQRLIRKHNQQSNITPPFVFVSQKAQSGYTMQNYGVANKFPDSPALSHDELHDVGAPSHALSRSTTLFPLSSGGRSGGFRTQQSIPLRQLSKDHTYESNAQHPYGGESSNSYQDSSYGQSTYREYHRDYAIPSMRQEVEDSSNTVGSSSRGQNFSFTSSPRPLRGQPMHTSPDRYRLGQPAYGQSSSHSPPKSGGGESSLSYLRPDPLRIHKTRSGPLPSTFSGNGYSHGMTRPENTRQGSLENPDHDTKGQPSSDYHHPRQNWQPQTQDYSTESDLKWKGKGVVPSGEDKPLMPGGSSRFRTGQSPIHPFGRQHSQNELGPSGGDTGAEGRPLEHYTMAPEQAPVAYGLPPLGRENAATQTDLGGEGSPDIGERKLSMFDLVSRLRN
ncbi:hypothetical protein MferCBS49748_003774 [Microsporum ferrugineum]